MQPPIIKIIGIENPHLPSVCTIQKQIVSLNQSFNQANTLYLPQIIYIMKMNHYVKCVTAGIVCSLMYGNVCAQDTFDLSSQRSEKQDVQAVPGKKVDHKGLILNPQPHQIVTMAGKTCDLSQGINLKDKQNKFAGYLDFLSPNKKGVKLTIDFGQKVAGKANVKAYRVLMPLLSMRKESPSRDLTNAVLSTAYKP